MQKQSGARRSPTCRSSSACPPAPCCEKYICSGRRDTRADMRTSFMSGGASIKSWASIRSFSVDRSCTSSITTASTPASARAPRDLRACSMKPAGLAHLGRHARRHRHHRQPTRLRADDATARPVLADELGDAGRLAATGRTRHQHIPVRREEAAEGEPQASRLRAPRSSPEPQQRWSCRHRGSGHREAAGHQVTGAPVQQSRRVPRVALEQDEQCTGCSR
eukprot:scaffold7213_cov118-Isochrysis_galbana.AAC.2